MGVASEFATIVARTGAKYIVFADGGASGWGMTQDEAWSHAESRHPENVLHDTQLYDSAPDGAMIEDRQTYLMRKNTVEDRLNRIENHSLFHLEMRIDRIEQEFEASGKDNGFFLREERSP